MPAKKRINMPAKKRTGLLKDASKLELARAIINPPRTKLKAIVIKSQRKLDEYDEAIKIITDMMEPQRKREELKFTTETQVPLDVKREMISGEVKLVGSANSLIDWVKKHYIDQFHKLEYTTQSEYCGFRCSCGDKLFCLETEFNASKLLREIKKANCSKPQNSLKSEISPKPSLIWRLFFWSNNILDDLNYKADSWWQEEKPKEYEYKYDSKGRPIPSDGVNVSV